MIRLLNAIKLGLIGCMSFSGRSTRTEFWWWIFFCVLVFVFSVIIVGYLNAYGIALIGLSLTVLSVPTSAVFTRRLHDIGKPGWWQIPMCMMGGIGMFFVLLGGLGFVFGILLFYMAIFLLLFSFTGVSLVSLCLMWCLFWLGRPGDDGQNLYGIGPKI